MNVSETIELDNQEDAYADATTCAICKLPKMITTYELGFQILQQQLSELREELKRMVDKIDVIEHK